MRQPRPMPSRRRGRREGAGSRRAGRQHIVPRCTGDRCTGSRCTRSSRQGRRARARACTVRDGASSPAAPVLLLPPERPNRLPGSCATSSTPCAASPRRPASRASPTCAPRQRSGFAPRGRCRATPRGAQGDAPRPTWPGSASGRDSETERIKQEAEQRIVARRAQLDQQLAAETTRAEAEAKAAPRPRVEAYERELDAYHAQLSDIADPAAFAAAAKRMPPPPQLADARRRRPHRTRR